MYSVIIGGCNLRHAVPFEMKRDHGNTCYVLLIVKSHAMFHIGNREYDISPGHAVLIDKDTPYNYYNRSGDYVDDFLRFDSEAPLLSFIRFELNKPFRISDPSRYTLYIQQLLWEHHYSEMDTRESNVDSLMMVILNNLGSSYKKRYDKQHHHPYYHNFLNLRLQIQAAPERNYSIETLSTSLGLSQSYFQHLYSYFFKNSFRNDVINMRIDMAKNLLTTTRYTIENIASICGYNSEIHFYRQFKKIAGATPSEYKSLFMDISWPISN